MIPSRADRAPEVRFPRVRRVGWVQPGWGGHVFGDGREGRCVRAGGMRLAGCCAVCRRSNCARGAPPGRAGCLGLIIGTPGGRGQSWGWLITPCGGRADDVVVEGRGLSLGFAVSAWPVASGADGAVPAGAGVGSPLWRWSGMAGAALRGRGRIAPDVPTLGKLLVHQP